MDRRRACDEERPTERSATPHRQCGEMRKVRRFVDEFALANGVARRAFEQLCAIKCRSFGAAKNDRSSALARRTGLPRLVAGAGPVRAEQVSLCRHCVVVVVERVDVKARSSRLVARRARAPPRLVKAASLKRHRRKTRNVSNRTMRTAKRSSDAKRQEEMSKASAHDPQRAISRRARTAARGPRPTS